MAQSLLECLHSMADWKQITARIRRARTGKDPAAQLTNLFTKTRDAMVAFELARYLESIGNSADAGRWYFTAAERFRRSDWKTKAQESATRLGATSPAEIPAAVAKSEESEPAVPSEAAVESDAPPAQPGTELESAAAAPAETSTEHRPAPSGPGQRHRRGRRGHDQRSSRRGEHSPSHRDSRPAPVRAPASEPEETPALSERPPRTFSEESPEAAAPSLRGRYGDPGLSSRLSQLEMNFRRLLACPAMKLDDADRAPAGPGVWVLTDSDLTTYYYVEACQTLRVAIPNMARGGTARRGGESIKPKLAEHLGIAETRVAKYLADHCVVRWLQMDDDASYFAHFLIAVLHPSLNE